MVSGHWLAPKIKATPKPKLTVVPAMYFFVMRGRSRPGHETEMPMVLRKLVGSQQQDCLSSKESL